MNGLSTTPVCHAQHGSSSIHNFAATEFLNVLPIFREILKGRSINMIAILIAIAVCLITCFLVGVHGKVPSWRTIKLFNKLPGPRDEPFFFGPIFKIMKLGLDGVVAWTHHEFEKYDWTWGCWFMGQPGFFIADPDVAEVILTSSKNISKGPEYDVIKKWLRDGIILSSETAMGIELDEGDDRCKEYIDTVKNTLEEMIMRAFNPFLKSDFLFDLTPAGRRHKKNVEILHGFTEKVIKEKKAEFFARKASAKDYSEVEGKKVFLDLLISLSEKENLSDDDIHEEVDAFMFGGHDTTSTALQWLMMHLAENPEIQERAYAEQVEIFGDSDRDVTKDDLAKMHYLDQVIKESLRLSPSIPNITRDLTEDARMPNGMTIPGGTKTSIMIYSLHRNPKHWPDPNDFKPERFSPEESKNRHPYSYIPFSAGPRNCIGQKFAMMEMKIGASLILRSCKISSPMKLADHKVKMLVVLEPQEPIKVNITSRN